MTDQVRDNRERYARWWARAGYALLVLTVVAPVTAMNWLGLTGFAETTLDQHGPAVLVVALSLSGAAMACVAFAVHAAVVGDSATGPRLLVWAFAGGAAAASVHHAQATYADPAAALFFGGMSIGEVVIFDLILRRLRRQTLREAGVIPPPLPRFRVLRWLFWRAETWQALKIAVRYELTGTREALAAAEVPVPVPASADDDLAALDKRQALEVALRATRGTVPPSNHVRAAVDWLAARNVQADRSYAYDVARQLGYVQPRARKAIAGRAGAAGSDETAA